MGDHDWVAITMSLVAIALSLWSLWMTRKAERLRADRVDRSRSQ